MQTAKRSEAKQQKKTKQMISFQQQGLELMLYVMLQFQHTSNKMHCKFQYYYCYIFYVFVTLSPRFVVLSQLIAANCSCDSVGVSFEGHAEPEDGVTSVDHDILF